MKCKEIHNKIIFYLENDLSKEERKHFEDHLQNCNSCKELLHEMQQTLLVIDTEKHINPNPFVITRIHSKLESLEDKRLAALPQVKLTSTFRVAAAIAVLLIAGFSGVVLGNKYVSNKLVTTDATEYKYLAEQYFPGTYESELLQNYLLSENE